MIIKARSISQGKAEGFALVSKKPISFYGDVDKKTGIIINKKKRYLHGKFEGKNFNISL